MTQAFGAYALMACAIGQYGPKIFGPLGKFILCDYLNCAVIVKRVDAKTRSKTSINDLLRD